MNSLQPSNQPPQVTGEVIAGDDATPLDERKAQAMWDAFGCDNVEAFRNVRIRLERGNRVVWVDVTTGATVTV